MKRRLICLAALAAALGAPVSFAAPTAAALPATLQFEARHNGVPTRLTLQIDGTRVSGQAEEPGVRLAVDGHTQDRRLELNLREPTTGLALARLRARIHDTHLDATVTPLLPGAESARLRFVPTGAATTAHTAAPDRRTDTGPRGAAGTLDARLVGRWVHQSMINSPGGAGGFASFTTERVLEFGADGRVQQTVRSVGGGGHWSAQGGRQVEFSGSWQVHGDRIWVRADGQGAYQPAGPYRFAGEYLVTEGSGGRRIWQR